MSLPSDNPLSATQSPEGTHGLVAWLDVLGFKQLLNQEPAKGLATWQTVWGFLNEAENLIKLQPPTGYQLSKLPSIRKRFRFTAFSDTIVASLDLSGVKEEGTEIGNPEWHLIDLFVRRIAYLTRRLFDFGLPTRGAIDYGCFYHSASGFGGPPFVRAEGESNKLSFAATIVTNAAAVKLDEFCADDYKVIYLFNHTIETKSDVVSERIFRILNAYSVAFIKATGDASDFQRRLNENSIEQIVESAFSDHGKAIDDPRVKEKLLNTIQLLKTAQQNSGSMFS